MPNYEYEPINDGIDANAIIKINSVQLDATEGDESLFDEFFETLAAEKNVEAPKEPNGESFEMVTEGSISAENGRIDIKYLEGAEGLPPWTTSVSFDVNDRGIISIIRSGELSHSFVIEQGNRHNSVYRTPYGPLEMCVRGRKVVNEMTENGGKIALDYTVELRGMIAQRTKMLIEVKKR